MHKRGFPRFAKGEALLEEGLPGKLTIDFFFFFPFLFPQLLPNWAFVKSTTRRAAALGPEG